ncbi:hypothetical protein RBB50_002695 [Rhinocladiella similis]
MCFRDNISDPTQQPIRITQSTEAHDSESYGDVAHLPRHSTASTAASSKRHSQSPYLSTTQSHHHHQQQQYAHLSPTTSATSGGAEKGAASHTKSAKELRQLKAKDPNVVGKMGMYSPRDMFAGSTALT